jgi:hypothetical protein
MAVVPGFLAPPAWTNQDTVLYHGTLDIYASAIKTKINLSFCKPLTDFGQGFYTTTILLQAKAWAWQMATEYNAKVPPPPVSAAPAVIRFRVPRDRLSKLDWLVFVRGDSRHRDYWSLVHYCRSGGSAHARAGAKQWYDAVAGPVAAFGGLGSLSPTPINSVFTRREPSTYSTGIRRRARSA